MASAGFLAWPYSSPVSVPVDFTGECKSDAVSCAVTAEAAGGTHHYAAVDEVGMSRASGCGDSCGQEADGEDDGFHKISKNKGPSLLVVKSQTTCTVFRRPLPASC